MPSRFEPCGLNQMYSLLYGAVPVVHRVGGLADTVVDADEPNGTGLCFNDATVDALAWTLKRAVELFADAPRYRAIQRRGMGLDFSWDHAAAEYEAVYRSG
jgi:starch synthase